MPALTGRTSRESDRVSRYSHKCGTAKFPGPWQRLTPAAPAAVLMEIVWLCPGRAAKDFRRQGKGKGKGPFTVAEANAQAIIPVDKQVDRFDADTKRIRVATEWVKAEADRFKTEASLRTYEHLQTLAQEATEARDKLMLKDVARNVIQASFLALNAPDGHTASNGRSLNAQITLSNGGHPTRCNAARAP